MHLGQIDPRGYFQPLIHSQTAPSKGVSTVIFRRPLLGLLASDRNCRMHSRYFNQPNHCSIFQSGNTTQSSLRWDCDSITVGENLILPITQQQKEEVQVRAFNNDLTHRAVTCYTFLFCDDAGRIVTQRRKNRPKMLA